MTPLRQEMINEMKLRGFSENTQESYILAVAGLARFYNLSPDKLGKEEVQTYLLYLSEERQLAWGSCNTVASGLRFFYTQVLEREEARIWIPPRKTRKKLPQVLSRDELERLFVAPSNPKHRVLLMTTYAAGLRVSELVNLQVKDIDSGRMMIRVRQGKGYKDRYTLLSHRLLIELRQYWRIKRPPLWLFPGNDLNRPMTRFTAELIYKVAKRKAGITKEGGIHILRHCFATNLLEAGEDIRKIQVLMGHSSIRTTARYLQLTAKTLGSTRSPLDLLDLSGYKPSP